MLGDGGRKRGNNCPMSSFLSGKPRGLSYEHRELSWIYELGKYGNSSKQPCWRRGLPGWLRSSLVCLAQCGDWCYGHSSVSVAPNSVRNGRWAAHMPLLPAYLRQVTGIVNQACHPFHWAEAEPRNLFPHSVSSNHYWLVKEVSEMKRHHFWAKHKLSWGRDLMGFLIPHPWAVVYLPPLPCKDWIFYPWYLLWALLDHTHESGAGSLAHASQGLIPPPLKSTCIRLIPLLLIIQRNQRICISLGLHSSLHTSLILDKDTINLSSCLVTWHKKPDPVN